MNQTLFFSLLSLCGVALLGVIAYSVVAFAYLMECPC